MSKICVIHHTSLLGGGTKSFVDILEMLKKEHEVIACIPKNSKEIINILVRKKIKYYEINSKTPTFAYYSGSSSLFSILKNTLFNNLFNRRKFVSEILELEPDTIIFNSIITIITAGLFPEKIKKICFVRETFRRTKIDNIFKITMEKYMNIVFFIANSEKEYLKLKNPICEVIPDCLESKEISYYSKDFSCKYFDISSKNFNILFMGGSDYIKGLDNILKAMVYLDDSYFLVIAGYFREDDLKLKKIFSRISSPRLILNKLKLRKYYFKLKKENKLKIVGFSEETSKLFCLSDIVVFPSNRAHQPRPCIEAGEYKKPVIISDFLATKEYFINNYNALVFKPYNSKDLSKKIKYLKENEIIRGEIGKNNYKMTKSIHNYENITKKLNEILIDIIN